MSESPRQVPVAVVGVSALFPGSTDAGGFWRDILAGRDLITDVPPGQWLVEDYYDPDPSAPDKTYCKRGGFLGDVPFDPVAYGMPPSNLSATDTTQLLGLVVAKQVLEDAFTAQFEAVDKSRMSVILGVTSGQKLFGQLSSRLQRPNWIEGMRAAGVPEGEIGPICDRIADTYVGWQENSFPGLLGNVVAGRIANRFNLGGTNCVVDAACASSLSALQMGLQELYLGTSDVVITGGADTFNDIGMYMCFSKTPALSLSGDCRPFSDEADGTIIGEGLAMIALKRLADAERDGDRIYGVVTGLGSSSDGRGLAVYAPSSAGQATALQRTYDAAGYGPGSVELVEAHGTGTKAGDAAEFEGLTRVFTADADGRAGWCALGSVKSQIGHTKAAAGAAGMFKALMALHHKVLPPTIKVDRPNPKLDVATSPFYINTAARPWVRGSDHPRRASVSSFGFGGSNFHLALEEYRGPGRRPLRRRTADCELVLFSADAAAALAARARAIAADARRPGMAGLLAHLARETQLAFGPGAAHRLAVVATDEADLARKLDAAAERIERAPTEAFALPTGAHYEAGAPAPGPLAYLFPGQGSQYVGMGGALAMTFDAARAVWDAAADRPWRVDARVFPAPAFDDATRAAQAAALTATEWAQPAIGLVSLSQLALLGALGLDAQAVGGHSYGEVTALGAAGALSHQAVVEVARRRGELMAEAARSTPGAMAAVDRGAEAVRALLADHPAVRVANDNGPRQVVISGPTEAVEAAERALAAAGAVVRRLPVATAFHSPVVAAAAAPFAEHLAGVAVEAARVPVWANTTADRYPADAAAARAQLASQIAEPVRFVEMIEGMYASGVRTFLEVGPGATLGHLVGEILQGRPHRAVSLDRKGQAGLAAFWSGLGQLAVSGVALDFGALWAEFEPEPDPRARVKGKFEVQLNGANIGRLYPPEGGAAARTAPNPPRPAPVVVPVAPVSTAPAQAAPAAPPVPAPPAPAAMPAAPVSAPRPAIASSDAFAAYQRALTDGHTAYLQTMEETLGQAHMAFLATMQSAYRAFDGTGALPAAPTTAPAPAVAPPVVVAPPAVVPPPAAVATAVVPAAPAPAAPAPPAPVAAPAVDLAARLLDIVAEKTGYPVEMLEMDMALEADLGVDSIKRVEILSAMQDRVPGLPALDPQDLAKLRTLGEIADHVRARLGASAGPVAISPAASHTPAAAPTLGELGPQLLAIVAEKTGYPVEMLEMDMALEADLGVDSIKRVEILSAMQDRVPGLPALDPQDLAKLRTLGEIADYVRTKAGASAVVAAPVAALAVAPVETESLLLAIVAEKTGYPVEMLEMDMALEADLGVDSIKRVEILSAMQDRVPGLPALDPQDLAKLRTLGEIADYIRGRLGGAAPAAVAPIAPAAPATAPGGARIAALGPLLLGIVAEKTGYPAEMLEMSMALEADLGVDSIKRVEILSAMQDRVPGLPELDPQDLAKLRTLGEIADYVAGRAGAAPASSVAPASTAPAALGLERLVLRAVAVAPTGHGMLREGPVHVLAGAEDALAPALAAALVARGHEAHLVTSLGDGADQVVLLGAPGAADGADAQVRQQAAFEAARAIASRARAFVTVQDTGGRFGVSGLSDGQGWMGGLAGLAKTAALEWPQARVKAIDLARGAEAVDVLAARLADELVAGGPELEVGLTANGERVTILAEREDAPTGACLLGPQDVVVATGGARGVTAQALVALARESRARFLLLGRSALQPEPACCQGATDEAGLKRALAGAAKAEGRAVTPAALNEAAQAVLAQREIAATLQAMRDAGSDARYVAVDARDALALGRALEAARAEWGPVSALVHGAGVLADKLIAEKTPEQFARVFSTKVDGLRALLSATAADPLRAIVLFSSVAARGGNVGQCDYAMANEVLNKVAVAEAARRGAGCRVKSLNWGPWAGGMVTPGLEAHFRQRGIALLPVADGARMLVDELRGDGPSAVEVVLGAALAPAPLTRESHLAVSAMSHPQLDGHRVHGTAVLPAMLVLDWFWRAAAAFAPGRPLQAVTALRVLRGAPLPGFDGAGDRLVVRVEAADPLGSDVALSLLGADGTRHYEATAVFASAPVAAPAAPAAPTGLAPAPWGDAPLYDALLFHRGAFAVVDGLEGLSATHGAATLRSASALGWPQAPAAADVAVLDGGLQLALLHGAARSGHTSLPTGLEAFRLYGAAAEGPVRCYLTARPGGTRRTVSDLAFVDAEGRLVAELSGVEMHQHEPVAVARMQEV